MRVSVTQFFSARSGGLVSVDENIVLDCYRLAKWYSVSPETFLNMPLSDVQLHLHRTIQLAKVMRQEAEREND
jgi:hypothetical protein